MRSVPTLLPAFNNVAAGSTATTRLPRNIRLLRLHLQYKLTAVQATIEADITEIRIKVNGKVIRQVSAAQLFIMNALNGIAFTAGMITINFAEPKRRSAEGEEYLALLAYESLGIGDVDIEVDIAGGAAAPALAGLIEFDNQYPIDQVQDRPGEPAGSAADRRTIIHWMRKVTPCLAAAPVGAPLTPANFFPNIRGWLHRFHAFDAVITQAIIRKGQTPFWNVTTTQLPALLGGYGMTKQAATFHGVLDFTQQYNDGFYIPSAPDLAVDFVASGAATGNQFTTVLEVRKALDLS